MLKREGLVVNRKRARRACARLGLQVRAKRRRRPQRPRVRMAMPTRPNERWPAGFMSGQLVATSVTGGRLALFPAGLGKAAATPKAVVCNNGPELTSKAMRFWSERSGAALNFIQPGKPTQNAFVESFNGKFRDSCLNRHWFRGIADVRRVVDDWRHHSMNGRAVPWAARCPPSAQGKPPECLFTFLATGPVLEGGSVPLGRPPAASSAATMPGLSLEAAVWRKGVSPSLSRAFGSAPGLKQRDGRGGVRAERCRMVQRHYAVPMAHRHRAVFLHVGPGFEQGGGHVRDFAGDRRLARGGRPASLQRRLGHLTTAASRGGRPASPPDPDPHDKLMEHHS